LKKLGLERCGDLPGKSFATLPNIKTNIGTAERHKLWADHTHTHTHTTHSRIVIIITILVSCAVSI